jgi:penicillin-binding protein 1A
MQNDGPDCYSPLQGQPDPERFGIAGPGAPEKPGYPWASPRSFSEHWSDFWERPVAQKGLRIAAISGGVLVVLSVIAWNALFFAIPKLPSADKLWTLNRAPAVQFVDAKGKTVAVRGNLYGPVVHVTDLPPYVGQAFIAAEDQRFMEHGGVDLQSISRAVMANFSAGRTVQGGSTLTQQLVKNLLVGDDQNIRRKAQEARLAIEMEGSLTKQQILDLYINRVYLGANSYGVEAATQTYFGKPAAELTLAEAAFLAALPKAPSRYAQDKTGPATTARVHYVLDRMVASGFVSGEASASAKKEKLPFVEPGSQEPVSGYVLDLAMKEARGALPDLPPDAVITLTVDGVVQRRAEAALKAALSVRKLGASQGAVVVMDRHGAIRALVGGADYKKSQFNRATQALRQPGSAFKTFVYAAALEKGLAPMDVRNDEPVKFGSWEPRNYNDEYRGPMTLARALAVSSNSVAAQIGKEIGPKAVLKLAQRFGIASTLHAYPSISLGTDAVTVLEMTRAYGVLANDGKLATTHIVSEIRDQRGTVLYRAAAAGEPQVFDRNGAATMTGMLANVVRSGTGAAAQIPGWQIAGKTGTSQSWRDAWFVGYSSELIGGVWIGNDDDRATAKATGGSAAAALFAKVMTAAHRGLKPAPLTGADLGAEWLGSEVPDEMTEEWFEIPEMGESPDLPGLIASAGEDTALTVEPVRIPGAGATPSPTPDGQTPTTPAIAPSGSLAPTATPAPVESRDPVIPTQGVAEPAPPAEAQPDPAPPVSAEIAQ